MAKIHNFDSLTVLGAFLGASHIFAPMKVKFGTGERTLGPLPKCQISRLSEQRVAPAGRKTYFWTTE